MSTQENSTIDVHKLLNDLKKIFDETFEDVSSAKDVKKKIDRLMNQIPEAKQWDQKLRDRFSKLADHKCNIKTSEFRSVREELNGISELLGQIAAKADQDDFQALSSEAQQIIVDKEKKDPLLKRHLESYQSFLRPNEHMHDPRICLFLAIFPENAVLRKTFLIYWWIGEGLVPDEDEGERVFKELLHLNLLLPHRIDKSPRVSKCKICPRTSYMLISEAINENHLKIEGGIPRFDPNYSRACLIGRPADLTSKNESIPETVTTIFNVNEKNLDFRQQWLAKRKRLVVLQLGRWQDSLTHHIEVQDESFLRGLKSQKDLKYLSLRGISRITSLPDSIKELVSLQILDLKACHNLETLPSAVTSLKKLIHLDVSECYLLESLPGGLHNLTSLRVLKGFIISDSQKILTRIEKLRSLNYLKRLSIHIGSEATIQKEELDKLEDLINVKCLKISWAKADIEDYSLSFPPELQKLVLEGIPHDKKPEWLKPSKLMKLETLYIKGGKLNNLLEYVTEQWNSVKYLILRYTKMRPIIQGTLLSMFPSLQYVKVGRAQNEGQEYVEHEWNRDEQVTVD